MFKLFQFICLGGALNQFEQSVTEYLEATKDMYKDLVCVAKDEGTNEIKPQSMIFRINGVSAANGESLPDPDDHPQNFTYVLVDPIRWHVTLF